jgi:carbon storage regulator
MLMIQRKVGQEIKIGDDIVIKVIEGTGRNVKIGIDAPPSLKIWRVEEPKKDETFYAGETVNHKESRITTTSQVG